MRIDPGLFMNGVKNGGGYLAELEPALWQKGRRELCVREAYMEG